MARKYKVAQLCDYLKGSAYIENTSGLAVYHTARQLRDTSRMREPWEQLAKVKGLLRQYRVMARMVDGHVTLHRADTRQDFVL